MSWSERADEVCLREVVVTGRDGRRLLGPVSLALAPGERVAVVGASGAGKSLLSAVLTGTLPADLELTGTVTAPRAALVHQDSARALNPLVRVGEQVGRPLRSRSTDRTARREAVVALLERVGLPEPEAIARRYSGELSGGQRQRVCLALAMACDARLVVADEATTALDVVTEAGVVAVLAAVPATLVVVTHDLTVAARVADRVLVLAHGTVVEDAPLPRLLAEPRHPSARALVTHARRLTDHPAATG